MSGGGPGRPLKCLGCDQWYNGYNVWLDHLLSSSHQNKVREEEGEWSHNTWSQEPNNCLKVTEVKDLDGSQPFTAYLAKWGTLMDLCRMEDEGTKNVFYYVKYQESEAVTKIIAHQKKTPHQVQGKQIHFCRKYDEQGGRDGIGLLASEYWDAEEDNTKSLVTYDDADGDSPEEDKEKDNDKDKDKTEEQEVENSMENGGSEHTKEQEEKEQQLHHDLFSLKMIEHLYESFEGKELEDQFDQFVNTIVLPQDFMEGRKEIQTELLSLLQKRYPKCILYQYGMDYAGIGNGDDPVCLYVDLFDNVLSLEKKPWETKPTQHIAQIFRTLKLEEANGRFCNDVQKTEDDRVVFEHRSTAIKVSVRFTEFEIVKEAELIKFVCSLDPRVRPLLVLARYWASASRIFDAVCGRNEEIRGRYLILLMLFHLANRNVIPSLAKMQSEEHQREVLGDVLLSFCTERDKFPSSKAKLMQDAGIRALSAMSLFQDFLERFGVASVKTNAVSLWYGKFIPKKDLSELSSKLPEDLMKNMKFWSDGTTERTKTLNIGDEKHPLCIQGLFNVAENLGLKLILEDVKTFQMCSWHTGQKLGEFINSGTLNVMEVFKLCANFEEIRKLLEEEKKRHFQEMQKQIQEEQKKLLALKKKKQEDEEENKQKEEAEKKRMEQELMIRKQAEDELRKHKIEEHEARKNRMQQEEDRKKWQSQNEEREKVRMEILEQRRRTMWEEEQEIRQLELNREAEERELEREKRRILGNWKINRSYEQSEPPTKVFRGPSDPRNTSKSNMSTDNPNFLPLGQAYGRSDGNNRLGHEGLLPVPRGSGRPYSSLPNANAANQSISNPWEQQSPSPFEQQSFIPSGPHVQMLSKGSDSSSTGDLYRQREYVPSSSVYQQAQGMKKDCLPQSHSSSQMYSQPPKSFPQPLPKEHSPPFAARRRSSDFFEESSSESSSDEEEESGEIEGRDDSLAEAEDDEPGPPLPQNLSRISRPFGIPKITLQPFMKHLFLLSGQGREFDYALRGKMQALFLQFMKEFNNRFWKSVFGFDVEYDPPSQDAITADYAKFGDRKSIKMSTLLNTVPSFEDNYVSSFFCHTKDGKLPSLLAQFQGIQSNVRKKRNFKNHQVKQLLKILMDEQEPQLVRTNQNLRFKVEVCIVLDNTDLNKDCHPYVKLLFEQGLIPQSELFSLFRFLGTLYRKMSFKFLDFCYKRWLESCSDFDPKAIEKRCIALRMMERGNTVTRKQRRKLRREKRKALKEAKKLREQQLSWSASTLPPRQEPLHSPWTLPGPNTGQVHFQSQQEERSNAYKKFVPGKGETFQAPSTWNHTLMDIGLPKPGASSEPGSRMPMPGRRF